MRRGWLATAALFVAGIAACSPSPATQPKDAAVDRGPPDLAPSNALVAARPYDSYIPRAYDPATAWPLVILLHGYSVNGFVEDAVFGLSHIVDSAGFLYVTPNGTVDQAGNRFWNATDACCNFYGSTVDDVAYLDAVIDDMSAHYHVDPKRIFITGHSNGGYMSHRYACDRASRVASFLSLAGQNWKDPTKCNPSEPVFALQVHGTADTSTPYGGGSEEPGFPPAPSAPESMATWAAKNGCDATPVPGANIDLLLDGPFPGAETTTESWPNCKGGSAALWSMQGANHVPPFKADWPDQVWGWLSAHPK